MGALILLVPWAKTSCVTLRGAAQTQAIVAGSTAASAAVVNMAGAVQLQPLYLSVAVNEATSTFAKNARDDEGHGGNCCHPDDDNDDADTHEMIELLP